MTKHLYPLAPFRENKPTYTGYREKQFPEKAVNTTIHYLTFPCTVYTRETVVEVKKNGYLVLAAPGYIIAKYHKSIAIENLSEGNPLAVAHLPATHYPNCRMT